MSSRMMNLSLTAAFGVALVAAPVACGAKDSSRVCAPANTWSQPAWNCSDSGEPEPEPEPEPVVKKKRDLSKVTEVKAKAVLRGDKIEILEKVQFETNSSDILEVSFELLDEVADILDQNPKVTKVRIEGHTDSKGRKRSNKKLSQRRANSVRDYLVDKGIDEARFVAKGFGQSKPIADNDTDEGRAENRRVEFNILESEK